ncbi:hypothetical protein B0H13DRAFT_1991224 [Mycena leptocephala]|nr:hypothetical protein B0H13DRAFT_1991224 [Mycena leptocephala]
MSLHRIAARNGNCDLFENDAGFDPCEWTPGEICHGPTREQCTCSSILYLVWAACDACSPEPIDTTWDDYSNQFDCPSVPQQFPSPFPTGEEAFPSWAFSMASATPEVRNFTSTVPLLTTIQPTNFDLAAASAFVLGPTSTPAPPPTSTPGPTPSTTSTTTKTSSASTTDPTTTGTTPSQSTTTSEKSVDSSASLLSTVLTSSQGIEPSHGLTVSSSLSITVSVSSGNTVPPAATGLQNDQLSTHRKSFPAGAIAGIVIGICLIIGLAVLFLCLRRRRRQAAYEPTPLPITSPYADTSGPSNIGAWDSDARIITTRPAAYPVPQPSITASPTSPSVPSNASAWNDSQTPLVRTARQHLRTESRVAPEKRHLNEGWDSSTLFAPASYPTGINARVLSTISASNTGTAAPDPDPDVVLQLRAMTARVRELEAQIESPQVYELPGTPPPGYSGDGRSSMRVSRQS